MKDLPSNDLHNVTHLEGGADPPLYTAVAALPPHTDVVAEVGQVVGEGLAVHVVLQLPVEAGHVAWWLVVSVIMVEEESHLPDIPVRYWRQPSGALSTLSQVYWVILILHCLEKATWLSTTTESLAGKFGMAE